MQMKYFFFNNQKYLSLILKNANLFVQTVLSSRKKIMIHLLIPNSP